jgi:hypothetical protein
MVRTATRLRDAFSQFGVLLTVGLLSVGLTGCYTQLQTADPAPPRTTKKAPRAQQSPAEEKPTYAREYRREYREQGGADEYYGSYDDMYVGDDYEYLYEYKYKYKYGAPYRYSDFHFGRHYDPFFHDPFFRDPYYGSGVRFSVSFGFGSPYYYHRPWRPYHSSFYGYRSYGYSPYSSYYVGNQYFYYGDVEPRKSDREYRPRSGAIGRGATSAGAADRRAVDRGVRPTPTRRAVHSSSSGGRIGRAPQSVTTRRAPEQSPTDRGRRVTRTRPSDDGARGRVGRSVRRAPDRTRTRRARTPRSDRTAREAGSRTIDRSRRDARRSSGDRTRRSRSDDESNRRSYRIPSLDPSDTWSRTPRGNDRRRLTPRQPPSTERPSLNRRPAGDRTVRSTQSRTRSRARTPRSRSSSSRARSTRSQSRSESTRSSRRSSRSDRSSENDDEGSR